MKAIALPLLAGLALTGAPALAQSPETEIVCHAVSEGGAERTQLMGRTLIERTADAGQFHLNLPADMDVESVVCLRTSAVPAQNDYEILLDGYPLYLIAGEGEARTMTLLEIADQQFRVRIIEGRLTAEERALAAERLEYFTAMVNQEG